LVSEVWALRTTPISAGGAMKNSQSALRVRGHVPLPWMVDSTWVALFHCRLKTAAQFEQRVGESAGVRSLA